jgi:flagellum-specific peptidoglycan hydrolase FlgJ
MENYDQEIYNIAIQEGFTPTVSKLIVAQARLESSNYGSNVFKCNNNMYGMKYIGQPLATRGTLAPSTEISKGCVVVGEGCNRKGSDSCINSDYYAKYASVTDSAKDTIQRLYKITRNGIGFNEINNSTDSTSFANNLKQRGYFGIGADKYASNLDYQLKKISILEFYNSNKKAINYGVIGGIIIAASVYAYYISKKIIS